MNTVTHNQNVRHPGVGRFLIPLLLMTALTSCHRNAEPVRLYGEAQGTYYSVQYYDPQQRNLQPAVDSLLADFDRSASLWVDHSLLRRLNANLTDSLDDILYPLLTNSIFIENYTGGAFNCRVGRIVQAWGFSFRERSEPDSTTLEAMLQAAHASFTVNCHRLTEKDPDTEFDFNAIAQGYAVDLLAHMLDSLGIEDYLIDVGGEVTARGCKANGSPWRVGIEQPAADSSSAPVVQTAIRLHDCSVVTSGSYRKYYERDGVRYSHTIDPSTCRPVQHSLLSVSVVEQDCWLADAMATAYMVMGLDSARAFIAAHQGQPGTDAVLFLYDDHGTLSSYATPAFEQLIIQ